MLMPALRPKREPRILVQSRRAIDSAPSIITPSELVQFLAPGDVMVFNDAATIPASLWLTTSRGQQIEIRLVRWRSDDTWECLLLGSGTYRSDTSDRGRPSQLKDGARLHGLNGLVATVQAPPEGCGVHSEQLRTLRFEGYGTDFCNYLFAHGQPIQYSYHRKRLPLSWLQQPVAGRPWAVEMPSAGRNLGAKVLSALGQHGVILKRLTHAAGISATGVEELDRLLPFPERSELPQDSLEAIVTAKSKGQRVIAVGTSVVRALEDRARLSWPMKPGFSEATLQLSQASKLRVVDGILSGLHPEGSSHNSLMQAFAPPKLLREIWNTARDATLEHHELGDSCLLL